MQAYTQKLNQLIKKHARTEWILLFILGALVGMAVKVEASKHITMGFNDYIISDNQQDFNFAKMAKDLAEKQDDSQPSAPGGGASCGQ